PRAGEPEADARVARGLVTAAADPPGGLPPPPGLDRDDGPYRVAVRARRCAFELEGDRAAGGLGPGVEVDQAPALVDEQGVGAAVVVEVARGQAPSEVRHPERRAGGSRRVGEPAPGPPLEQLRRHLPRELRAAVVDVAVGAEQVEPAVV